MHEKQVNLRKDLAEMQEWMTQVDEEFLMRDFEYKGPEELEASLEEMKVGKFSKNLLNGTFTTRLLILRHHNGVATGTGPIILQ